MIEGGTAFELVDVRTGEERALAKIDGSRLLDQSHHDALLRLDPNTPIVFQCHHGMRSQHAAEYFRREGFRNLYNLRGGIDAWSQFVDPAIMPPVHNEDEVFGRHSPHEGGVMNRQPRRLSRVTRREALGLIGAGAGLAFATGCRGDAPPQDAGDTGVEDAITYRSSRPSVTQGITVGDIEISSVVETDMLMTPTSLIPEASAEGMARHREWLAPDYVNEDGNLIVTIRTYVVRTRHHTILVDTGFGSGKSHGMPPENERKGNFLHDLQIAGVAPDAVDIVLCTHLHIDHVGWNTRLENGRWVPTFPRARYLFGRKDWEYFSTNDAAAGAGRDVIDESVRPVVEAGQVDLIDGTHAIEDGVLVEPLPGHTPGQVSLRLTSNGKEALLIGDLMHHPVQCAEPQWNSVACADVELARAARRRFLERYAETNVRVLTAHFAAPTGGYIVTAGNAWRFEA